MGISRRAGRVYRERPGGVGGATGWGKVEAVAVWTNEWEGAPPPGCIPQGARAQEGQGGLSTTHIPRFLHSPHFSPFPPIFLISPYSKILVW